MIRRLIEWFILLWHCPECDGDGCIECCMGGDEFYEAECCKCRGTGRRLFFITKAYWKNLIIKLYEYIKYCPRCSGDIPDWKCSICRGSGLRFKKNKLIVRNPEDNCGNCDGNGFCMRWSSEDNWCPDYYSADNREKA